MRKLSVFALVLCLGGLVFASLPALADNLDDHVWHIFAFGGTGSQSSPTDFFATGPATIKVTDCCLAGDQFTLYDNGILLGTSSFVPIGPGDGCPNADACYADPLYSHGAWLVGAGVNDITIFMAASPYGSGGAYIEATATPEPGSIILLTSGVLGAFGVIRRRFLT